jgi:serine/threonine-protein kinase
MAEGWKVWEGTTVDGRFRLEEYLGGSGHSAVFRTQFESAPAVIKFVPASAAFVALAGPAWDSAARLSHLHLLRLLIHGTCRLGDTELLYVVTEAADEDLGQAIQGQAIPPGEVQDFLPAVLDALDYLHHAGFAHAALKPANILAVRDELKLSTDSIRPLGTLANESEPSSFNPPELLKGRFTSASDVWSLGATLLNVLTGRPPDVANLEKAVPESVPDPLNTIVTRCLAPSAGERWSLARIRDALRPPDVPASEAVSAKQPAAIAERPGSAPATAGLDATAVLERAVAQDHVPGSSGLRRLWIPAISFALILLAIYGASVLTHRGSSKPAPVPNATADATSATVKAPTPAPSSDPAVPRGIEKTTGYSPGSIRNKAIPDVSPSARATIQGRIRVMVEAQVDQSGNVTEAKLTKPGPSQYFASHALAAARKFTFDPAQSDGQPVSSRWDLHFTFSRHGTTVDARNVHK